MVHPDMNLLIDSCFLSAVPLLARGWIVPVGGSTPDRLRNSRPAQGNGGDVYNSHMLSSPAVSVVLTVHNRPRHLAEAAGSILSQTFRDLELLIVDDCSDNPQTQALAKQIAENDPRVRILRRDANGGPAAARNTGAAQARAKLIAFMDDDDISEPNRLEKQIAFLAENPEVASVSCRKIVVDQRGNFLRHHSPPRATVALSRPKPFVGGAGECDRAVPPASEGEYAPLNASAVVRRECFEAIGGYRECYRAAEDHDIILRMQERFAMAELPEELYRYRRPDDANVSTSPHNWRANIAIEISARRRRLGFPDPMAEGRLPDDDFLLSHFGGLSLPRRIYFIGKFAGPSRRLIRAGKRGELRRMLSFAERLCQTRAERRALFRVRLRVAWWRLLFAFR